MEKFNVLLQTRTYIRNLIEKYSDPKNRFYRIKNYRIKSQVLALINVSVILAFSQNCANQMRVLESNVLSSSIPEIVLRSDVPILTNSRNLTIIFDVIGGASQFESATCQVDNETIPRDCSAKVVALSNLADGDHTVRIVATDNLGIQTQPYIVMTRVDATLPQVSFLQSPPATTGSTSATLTFSASDNLSGVNRIECSLDNATFAECTSPRSYSGLSAGSHSLRVRARDNAQNYSNIATASWTITAGAPMLNITSQPSSYSNSQSASFAFNGTVGGTPMSEFECKLDTANYSACNNRTVSYSSLAQGAHTFMVRGRISGGTFSQPQSVNWTVDSVAPSLPTITTNVTNPTKLKEATFNFVSTDATAGIANFQCALNSGSFSSCTSPHSFELLPDGSHTFRVRAIDRAGNTSAVAQSAWVVDATLPVLAFTSRPSNSSETDAHFSFTATDTGVGIQTLQCSLNNETFASCTSPQDITVAEGSHTFRVQAIDRAGNVQTISHSWVVGSEVPADGVYPILFVTSVPGEAFQHLLSNFGNHGTDIRTMVPGGDLYIRYPDGELRNITREAGYGVASGEIQGDNAIMVREPTVHWSGEKAIFSMMIGGTPSRYNTTPGRKWQMYEVTGLQKGQTVQITKVPGQPSNYNNVSPMYGAQDDIFFTTDAPLFGMTHTYPQLDEYESTTTVTGIWKLNPVTQKVTQIQHSPSGAFHLFLDSFGRVIFTRWDHLKRDQQADGDREGGSYGSFDYKDESPTATRFNSPERDAQGRYIADERGVLYDQFPEALSAVDRSRRTNENYLDFNKFTPWMIHEDGSEEETVNHMGRDEIFRDYRDPSFRDDPNLTYIVTNFAKNRIVFSNDGGFHHFKEDVNRPGYFLGVFSLEFGRQTSGRVVEFKMDPGTNPEDMEIIDYSGPDIDRDPTGANPRQPGMTGHYRNPLRLSDGSILVSHTDEYRQNVETVSNGVHSVRYKFQLKKLIPGAGQYRIAGPSITGGIVKNVRWWRDDANPHQYNGVLNETDPVEIRPRPRPVTSPKMKIADVEKTVMQEEGVDEVQFRDWLKRNNLAVMISRNVTIRDRADVPQPFNLRIPGGVSNIPKSGKVYDISKLQVFQADMTRGYTTVRGRRVYAKPIHNSPSHENIETYWDNKEGFTALGTDGSMAAIVPAGRALTWQLTSPDGTPVVRERYWVTFAPGEVRTCASCHGLNKLSHNNLPEPVNKPEAFRNLLNNWKTQWFHINP